VSGSRRSFSASLAQFAVSADPGENLGKAEAAMADAARRGAHVVCLPELFLSPYFCQVEDASLFDLAEPADGPTVAALRKAARSLSVAVVVPIFERRAPGLYHNSAVVVDSDGEVAGIYRKMHIPDDPAFYEKFYFTPGDLGFRSFATKAGRLGVLICWDQWYPEGARLTALTGAEILFYPTAIGWHPREKAEAGAAQRDAWMTVQRGHAVANGVYVAAVNRVGHEVPPGGGDGIEFWGTSFLCDPQGQILVQASTDREETLVAEVDRDRIEDVRRNWPFLRDRRIDAYGGVTRRFLDGEDPFGGKR
jgi:N-carbamoylputrescine amidase